MIKIYKNIWRLLTVSEQKKFSLVIVATLIMVAFEVTGVAAIVPFLAILTDPTLLETQPALTYFVETSGSSNTTDAQIAFGALLIVLIASSMVVRSIVTYTQFRFCLMRSFSISNRLIENHLSKDYLLHITRNSSEMSRDALSEVDQVVRDGILPSVLLISNLAVAILLLAIIFAASPLVALGVAVLLGAVYLLIYLTLRKRVDRIGVERLAANQERFLAVQEISEGIKELKILAAEQTSLSKFRLPSKRIANLQTLSQIYSRLPRFAVETSIYIGFILLVLGKVVSSQETLAESLPIFSLFAVSAAKLFPTLQSSYQQASQMRYAAPSLSQLVEKLTLAKSTPILASSQTKLQMKNFVELRDVNFKYPEGKRNSLDSFSIRIAAGTSFAFVGPSGSGKTTAVDLILGLLEPSAGELIVDDRLIDRNNARSWQRNIGYVPQQIFLLDATIAENIAFGSGDKMDLERVRRAASMAQLDEFVSKELPQGYCTRVGERGVRFSGGQRQRIGIARALYRDPEVLILDEATSALDSATEREFIKAIEALSGQKTIIMIAHRLSTVRKCDRIAFVKDGRIAGTGTFDELTAHSAEFRKFSAGSL